MGSLTFEAHRRKKASLLVLHDCQGNALHLGRGAGGAAHLFIREGRGGRQLPLLADS